MEEVKIEYIGSPNEYQEYSYKDTSLISKREIQVPFGSFPGDYVEYFIYDLNDELIASNYFVRDFTPVGVNPTSDSYTFVNLNPEGDIKSNGIDRGEASITYNFFRQLFTSSYTDKFWIGEISSDRTEIRVFRQDLSNAQLQTAFLEYQTYINEKAYYPDFILNFGNNVTIIGVNVLYAATEPQASILFKLYEPLPTTVKLKDTFWVVDKISEPASFNVTIELISSESLDKVYLRGPNYNVEINKAVNQVTPFYNYESLISSAMTSSYQQLKSMMDEKGLDINVDYSDFNSFSHFSSALERVGNFVYKLGLIGNYQADISASSNIVQTGTGISANTSYILQNKINNIIEKFDGYEYYLYFQSGSTTWPKSTSTKPYTLYSVTSSQASNWLGGINIEPTATTHSMYYSASLYDELNPDLFSNTIPNYLRDDEANAPYFTFLNMVGQHFDNIWIYYKDVTEKNNAENSVSEGISKDLVADALRSLGINLYTNSNISDSVYYSMLGINPYGGTLPPTGSEIISTYVTSSIVSLPAEDITLEYYKRLYHNLPYLLKTKGTERGLRALINCFGIPDTILKINEFGGVDSTSTVGDYKEDIYTGAYVNSPGNCIKIPWAPSYYHSLLYPTIPMVPDAIEFRFKSDGLPTSSLYQSQSVFQVGTGSFMQFGLGLNYNPNDAVSGSIYNYYGSMSLYLSGAFGYKVSTPIFLPFYNPNLFWNVMLLKETGSITGSINTYNNRYWVYAKSSLYNEEGGVELGFEASSSIYIASTDKPSYNQSWTLFSTASNTAMYNAYLGGTGSNSTICADGVNFQGQFQEFRYWVND